MTLGLSHNAIKDPIYDTKQFNPKLGFSWDASPQTKLRLAAFRTLKRPITADQSIEPSQVAGFNQFYDDPTAADAKTYGVALEHRATNKLFTGIELTKRDLEVPYIDIISNKVLEDQTEYGHRVYINWALNNTTAISAEYQYEEFDREQNDIVNQPKRLVTHKLPLSLKLNYPSGWSGSLTTSYYSQDIAQFVDPIILNSKDNFWMTDMNIGYRFPKRLGSVNIEVRNLFDDDFMFYDAAFRTETSKPATLYHDRSIWLRLALTFD